MMPTVRIANKNLPLSLLGSQRAAQLILSRTTMNIFCKAVVLLIVMSGSVSSGARQLIIKFSTRDCVNCNSKLKYLANLNARVVFRTAADTIDFNELAEYFPPDQHFTKTVSDSLFYAFDSSGRSKVYVLDGSKLLYSEILAPADLKRIRTLLQEGSASPGSIRVGAHIPEMYHDARYLYLALPRERKI